MVVAHIFQDVFKASNETSAVTLPTYKENFLRIEFAEDHDFKTVYNGKEPPLPFANSEVFYANISAWRRLTAVDTDCKPVYEITFDIKGSEFTFSSGDTIGVIPRNSDVEVDSVISHLDLTSLADTVYKLSVDTSQKGAKQPAHVPIKSTLRHVLTHCIDLRCVLKKLFLLALSRYTKNENEKKVLEYLCSKEGSTTYTTQVLNKNLCILDIFKLFKSCKPPIEIILANLPRLLPRPYSIVNSGLKNCDELKICFSVMDIGNNRKGVTTGWLEELILNKEFNLENAMKNLNITNGNNSDNIPIYMRKNVNEFSLPKDLKTPLLLLGAGTGVAPFIGFLEEREFIKSGNPEIHVGDSWLYFGCRNPKLDFIYEEELEGFVSRGSLNQLKAVFSRIENNGIKYVQDALLHDGENVTKLIKGGASIFICGDHKTMAAQVKENIVKCLVKYANESQQDAENIISIMEKEKKYIVDIWS